MVQIQVYDKDLLLQLKRAREAALDLTTPFKLIQASWFKGNQAIFALKSPGKYQDLKPTYKEQKVRRWGFVYPILKASGVLERSLVNPGDPANQIHKQWMTIGTSVPYAHFHQSGTRYMPARPPVLLGPEQVAPDALKQRQELWVQMISKYIMESLNGKI